VFILWLFYAMIVNDIYLFFYSIIMCNCFEGKE